jgi:predicted transposase YbfD/YdcC
MEAFWTAFEGVDDPRKANARYSLSDVLFIALAALLSGSETCSDMAEFGTAKFDYLSEIIDLPHGTPSHDTFSRVFRLIDPQQFEPVFAAFAASFKTCLGEVVAVDGKALRGAYERGAKSNPLHTVSLWATQARATIATTSAPGRNEIKGVLAALQLVDLTGCMVTADALHCRSDVTEMIVKQGGDFCITLKANQPGLASHARRLLDAGAAAGLTGATQGPDISHDREETRTALVVPADTMSAKHKIKQINAFGRVTSLRQPTDGAMASTFTRLYILSKVVSADELLSISRAHWGIENNLHNVLDVTLKEDACRARKDHGPLVLAALRRIALNLIKTHPHKASIRLKIKRAAWNNQFLSQLLAHMR